MALPHVRLSRALSLSTRRAALASAFVFDIDGVLLRGNAALPRARESLERLRTARVPFVLLTNGGGETEQAKAHKLSALLGPIDVEQVILSHTPMRDDVASFRDRKVLILGCRDVVEVARSYGLTRPVTAMDLTADWPERYPFHFYERREMADREEPIAAVFKLHDPSNWAPEIQVTLDVLRGGWPYGSGLGVGGKRQCVPFYSSNADLVFAAAYPVPRLAGGSFTMALRALWRAQCGEELEVTQYGKPFKKTYDFAARQLSRWAAMSGAGTGDGFSRIFMVGDNPQSDIEGANRAGAPWYSVLVRSGVFRGGDNDLEHPAKVVVQGVEEAVALAFSE